MRSHGWTDSARFFHLQVVQHETYASKAEENRISIVPIAPNRGLILDRQASARRLGEVEAHAELAQLALHRAPHGCPHELSPARVREREPHPMAGRESVRHVVETQGHLDRPAGLERLPGLVSRAMRQVERAIADPGRAPIG